MTGVTSLLLVVLRLAFEQGFRGDGGLLGGIVGGVVVLDLGHVLARGLAISLFLGARDVDRDPDLDLGWRR